jgi:hypothetical protein
MEGLVSKGLVGVGASWVDHGRKPPRLSRHDDPSDADEIIVQAWGLTLRNQHLSIAEA